MKQKLLSLLALMLLAVGPLWSQTQLVKAKAKSAIAFQNDIYYTTLDSLSETSYTAQLWRTNGNTHVLVKQFDPAIDPGLGFARVVGNHLYFTYTSNVSFGNGFQLWSTDGTSAGTQLIEGVNTVPNTTLGDRLVFAVPGLHDDFDLKRVFITDGTTQGTRLLKNFTEPNATIASLGVAAQTIYFTFSNYDNPSGTVELWKSDGTVAGTQLLPIGNFYSINNFATLNGSVYFVANGTEIRKLDANQMTSTLVKGFSPEYAAPRLLASFNGSLIYAADNGVSGYELWKTDGTAAGTVMIKDIRPGGGNGFVEVLNQSDNALYLVANDGSHGDELWKTDGTSAGTVMVKDISTGSASTQFTYSTFGGNTLYFDVNGKDLWSTDGMGTVLRLANSFSTQLAFAHQMLYFVGQPNGGVPGLWKYDTAISANCQATGTILREYWAKVNGNQTSDVPVNKVPTSSSYLTSFEGPTGVGENYASRIRGYLCAPETGNYTFWIASDDYGDLYLSSDDNPANKQLIAYIKGWSNPRQYNKHYSQKSALIYLEKGKRYYIEALHKQGWVNDNLSVAWRLPSSPASASPMVIPGSVLSPFVPGNARMEYPEVANAEAAVGLNLQAAPNPFSAQTTVSFTALESGSAVLDLYDLQGKKLQRVFDAQVQAGEKHQAQVNGNRLGQGLYLLRLVNGSQVQNLKVLVNQ